MRCSGTLMRDFCARSCSAPPLAAARAPGRPGGRAGAARPLLPLRRLARPARPCPCAAPGFTPGEQVDVAIDGVVVDTATALPERRASRGSVTAPYQKRGERPFTLTVTEVDQPANTASADEPRDRARPAAEAARGRAVAARALHRPRLHRRRPFVYAHYVRKGKLRKTVRLGAAQGPCGRIDVRRRQIPIKRPATGRWTLQVDNQQRLQHPARERLRALAITVRRVPRPGG